ncbi:MAG: radical SAM family heme chaperone HemW [Bacteroidota bacterium]
MAGIYIHIPFCKTKCPYCDFFSITDISNKEKLINGIQKELQLQKNYLGDQKIETIYFGGGTPTFVSLPDIESIIKRIYQQYSIVEAPEITIECNPDDLSSEYLKELRKIADFRINLGVQSFNEKDLKFLQRRHSVDKTLHVLSELFSLDFKNVGIDLIYGLPGSNLADLEANLTTAFQFPIQHLSAYHLTIEPQTPFYQQMKKGVFQEVSEELSRQQFFLLIEMAKRNRFDHYEISNFARDGAYSKHNTSYWKGIPYLGVGPSAHSFDGAHRHWNVADVNKYVQEVEQGNVPLTEEKLTPRDRFNEYLMISLRTKWGVDLKELNAYFKPFMDNEFTKKANNYLNLGLMRQAENRIYLSDEGKFLSDSIIMDFFS